MDLFFTTTVNRYIYTPIIVFSILILITCLMIFLMGLSGLKNDRVEVFLIFNSNTFNIANLLYTKSWTKIL